MMSRPEPQAHAQLIAWELERARDRAFARSIDARITTLLRLRAGGRYIDVGCGAGDDAIELAQVVGPGGLVVGLDINASAMSRQRPQPRGSLAFAAGDAQRLPFADGAFDGCRSERLLQHVENPGLALAEMARVTKGGGTVVASEADWGTAVIEGAEPGLSRAVLHAWGSSLQNGFIGRALPNLFRQAALVDVAVEPLTESTTLKGFPSARGQTEWDVVAGARIAVARGAISPELANRWLDQLDHAVRDGSFFMAITCFLVAGRRE